jgi:hypothetical protein
VGRGSRRVNVRHEGEQTVRVGENDWEFVGDSDTKAGKEGNNSLGATRHGLVGVVYIPRIMYIGPGSGQILYSHRFRFLRRWSSSKNAVFRITVLNSSRVDGRRRCTYILASWGSQYHLISHWLACLVSILYSPTRSLSLFPSTIPHFAIDSVPRASLLNGRVIPLMRNSTN